MVMYGVMGAGCCLAVFTIIVFGIGDGNLGSASSLDSRALDKTNPFMFLTVDSNNSIGDGSELVFRARSATFCTSLTLSATPRAA